MLTLLLLILGLAAGDQQAASGTFISADEIAATLKQSIANNVVDQPINRRISILILNKAAEEAFFHDGGRTSIDESTPASSAIPAVVEHMQPVTAALGQPVATGKP